LTEIPDAILIAGPTASGKSVFAIEQAEKYNGTIINADSMQVYPILRIITARPDDVDLAKVPHLLYGHASLEKSYSVAQWVRDAKLALDEVLMAGRTPIFVGGTGLYFKALLEGLAEIPEIPGEIRQFWRDKSGEVDVTSLYATLQEKDPLAANALKPNDRQRILRALEVKQATGRSIVEYQAQNQPPILKMGNIKKYLVLPDRAVLHRRIENRFDQMLDNGALDEVKALGKMEVFSDHPVLKAIGVPQLTNYLQKIVTLDEARIRCKAATRQYAKRQSTWFRNQLGEDWELIDKII